MACWKIYRCDPAVVGARPADDDPAWEETGEVYDDVSYPYRGEVESDPPWTCADYMTMCETRDGWYYRAEAM